MVAETLACRNIPNMADSSKNIKKKIKMLQQEHIKRIKYHYINFQMNTHSSLPPSSPTHFFEEGK